MDKFSLDSVLAQEVDTTPIAVLTEDYEAPDFEDEDEAEDYEEQAPEPSPRPTEIPSNEIPKAMPHSHFAENLVGLIDGLQSSLIPMWRKSSLFTARELEILDTLDTTGGTVYEVKSPEYKILSKWNKHLNFAAELPFTENEKARLVAATERYAATMQITVSPFTGLLMAFGEVAATRAALFLND